MKKQKPKYIVILDGAPCQMQGYSRKVFGRKLIPAGGTLVAIQPGNPRYFVARSPRTGRFPAHIGCPNF